MAGYYLFKDKFRNNNMPQTPTSEFKPTLDTVINTDDSFLMAFIKSAIKTYIDESGISKSDMERFVTNYVTFDNGFLKASGPAFQMKVVAEAIETYIYDNNIHNDTLEKFIFDCQKAYRQIYDLPTYKYSSEHLQLIGNDYKTYLSPVAWSEDIHVTIEDFEWQGIIQDSIDLPQTTFLVPTVNYAEIEVEDLSPQLALKHAVQLANEDAFEYIGDAEMQRVIASQDIVTGKNSFEIAPVSVNPIANSANPDNAEEIIRSHPKGQMIFDHVMNEALIIRDQNVSNSDFGDVNPDIYLVDEFDDYNSVIASQTKQTQQIKFITDIIPADIISIFETRMDTDGSYRVGYSGVLTINPNDESDNSWYLKTDNFIDLMKISAQIEYFKIEREFDNGNLENIYETPVCPHSLYKKYVSNTGKDPIDKHPDIMEKFHFPTKNPSDYKPNTLETLLNFAKANEKDILTEMDEALDEFSDSTGQTVEELLADGDIHETQSIRDKYDYHQGKASAIAIIIDYLSNNDLQKSLDRIPKIATETHDLLSFQRNQQGLTGEDEIYSIFMKELDKLSLTTATKKTPQL